MTATSTEVEATRRVQQLQAMRARVFSNEKYLVCCGHDQLVLTCQRGESVQQLVDHYIADPHYRQGQTLTIIPIPDALSVVL